MISLARLVGTPRNSGALAWMLAVVTLAFGCHGGPAGVFAELDEARARAASVRVQFNKADDASNRAVMADTDEASSAFARDAEKAAQAVERDVAALAPLLDHAGVPSELKPFQDFRDHFSEYRTLDHKILALAVENTNLKAQRLSFGPAREAADKLRDTLATIAGASASQDRCRVDELVAKATLAVREIQVLQAPHIAESDDAAMTRLEDQMLRLHASASDALKALTELVASSSRPTLAAASATLDQFKAVSDQIVTLSRRNTNVRSLELSLRTKPALVTSCDDSLKALQDALTNRVTQGTR